jgi:PTH1 family peptidyl-tRNA hydrolase
MSIALVAGLGNPGRSYEQTRHNLGWMVLDALAREKGLSWSWERRFDAETARWTVDGRVVHLVKPLAFMNDSGRPLQALASFLKIPPVATAVVYDDLNIALGLSKVSVTGSAGGHNGVASVLEHLGDGFVRYRLGIGPRHPPQMDLKDFVLSPFTSEQQLHLQQHLPTFVAGLVLLVREGADRAMNQLNRRVHHEPEQPQLPRDLHP